MTCLNYIINCRLKSVIIYENEHEQKIKNKQNLAKIFEKN